MKCIRILPETWARILWPFSSSTRNIALGRGSITRPSTSITSSFATGIRPPFQSLDARKGLLNIAVGNPVPTLQSLAQLFYDMWGNRKVSEILALWVVSTLRAAVGHGDISLVDYLHDKIASATIPPCGGDYHLTRPGHLRALAHRTTVP